MEDKNLKLWLFYNQIDNLGMLLIKVPLGRTTAEVKVLKKRGTLEEVSEWANSLKVFKGFKWGEDLDEFLKRYKGLVFNPALAGNDQLKLNANYLYYKGQIDYDGKVITCNTGSRTEPTIENYKIKFNNPAYDWTWKSGPGKSRVKRIILNSAPAGFVDKSNLLK